MKGDFTRSTFDQKKHYSSVRMQQGRVQLDADWNEQADITSNHIQTQGSAVIGLCGAPVKGGGFKIDPIGDNNENLKISSGTIYVNGILCENDSEITIDHQDDLPDFEFDGDGGKYLAYLDVWQRHITSLEDPDIREVALGGPNTATRTKTVCQVKLLQVDDSANCLSEFEGWNTKTAPSSGKLSAKSNPGDILEGSCIVPPGAGYRRLENQLYRVEIHEGGQLGTATFKWSRDNGSVVTSWLEKIGNGLKVSTSGRDESLGFASKQWVELTDDTHELKGELGTLVKLDGVDGQILAIDPIVADSIDIAHFPKNPRVRRWDSDGKVNVTVPDANEGWIPLEDGVEVKFEAGTYKTGDYWLIPARTAKGDVEWPRDEEMDPLPQLPHGIEHHYCRLALLQLTKVVEETTKNKWDHISDCRQLFPPLTDITADDVSFDNSLCNMPNVETVQDALNSLCQRRADGCMRTVGPGEGWKSIFDSISDEEDVRICFGVGEYLLDKTIILRNKGHLTISGCGSGTRIIAPNSEMVFLFENCKSVTVQDIYAESGVTGSGQDQLVYLNGTLTFCACHKVNVDKVELKCAAGAQRAASCINVRDAAVYDRKIVDKEEEPVEQVESVTSVRINRCDLHMGHQQVGILLVNVLRAQVEDNILQVSKKPGSLTLPVLLENKKYRSAVRNLMISEPVLGEPPDDDVFLSSDTVGISAGNGFVWFKTDTLLRNAWENWITQNPPKGVQNDRDLLLHLIKIANNVLLNQGMLINTDGSDFKEFSNWYGRLRDSNPAAGSQGIVVAGSIARDIQVLNNKIWGVLQGIHIGVSHREVTSGSPDIAGTVHIKGNNIGIILSPVVRNRHGIFVGNCDSLIVQDNYARIKRVPVTSEVPIDGIYIYGHLGRMMIVRQNHLVNSTVGIRVVPLSGGEGKPQWIVADNVAPKSDNAVLAPPEVRGKADNYA